MTGPAGDFHVDTDALGAVADSVKNLVADIQGDNGYIAGNMTEFTKAADISQALAGFYGTNEDGFAEAYSDEYTGILTTYRAIIDQLNQVSGAAAASVAAYTAEEAASKATVGQSGGV